MSYGWFGVWVYAPAPGSSPRSGARCDPASRPPPAGGSATGPVEIAVVDCSGGYDTIDVACSLEVNSSAGAAGASAAGGSAGRWRGGARGGAVLGPAGAVPVPQAGRILGVGIPIGRVAVCHRTVLPVMRPAGAANPKVAQAASRRATSDQANTCVSRPSPCATGPDCSPGRRSWCGAPRTARRSARPNTSARGTPSGRPDSCASACRLRNMSSTLPPGKSVRPQPSRNSVSPATSRPSSRKHWLPGVWPGVCSSSISTSPTDDLVAVLVRGQVAERDAGDPRNPFRLMGVDVDRHADPLQQLGQALELEAHHRAADVVGVVVGDQHPGQVHAVGFEGVEQVVGGVGRVDDDAVAGLAVADQVGEVAHLLGDHVAGGEVAAGQQLPEVQTVLVGWAGHPAA